MEFKPEWKLLVKHDANIGMFTTESKATFLSNADDPTSSTYFKKLNDYWALKEASGQALQNLLGL